jgi:hypothetical protein
MLGKLLSLLLHAKSGAISGLFLLGATGALVSVSTQNGVTTITITEASPSPSASASTSASPTPSASPTASPSASASPSSSPSSSSCADQAKALAFQVQRVDTAFKGFHADLMKLRGTRSVADIEKADVMLKVIRQAAVKAIHKTFDKSCIKKDDDEDESAETEDHDAAPATTLSLLGDRKHDEDNDNDSDHHKTKPAPLTFTGDATSIADQAIAAMQVAFDTAKNAPASTPKPSRSPESSRSPRPSHSPEPSRSPKHGDHD